MTIPDIVEYCRLNWEADFLHEILRDPVNSGRRKKSYRHTLTHSNYDELIRLAFIITPRHYLHCLREDGST